MGCDDPVRCAKCLMPLTYPGVSLDDRGVCNLCRNHQPFTPLGEDVLREKLASRRGRKYDCIIGLSGGKDSSYLAWLAAKRYGLRVLGVSYSFAFMSDLAEENVRQLSTTLGFDLVRVTSPDRLEYNLIRNHISSVAATRTTWGQCLFCHYGIDAILYRAATEHDVPFILSGVTKYELWNPGKRMSFLKRRLARLPLRDKLTFAWYQLKAYWYLVRQRRIYRVPGNSVLAAYDGCALPKPGPEVLKVYDYVRWDQDEIEQTLVREAGWRRPEMALTWRYDCSLGRLLDFTYKEEFGISTIGVYLSHLIRDGGITREKALAILREAESRESLNRGAEVVFDFIKLSPRLRRQFLRAD
jgi:hypothetical protein